MNTHEQAIEWWNELTTEQKTFLADGKTLEEVSISEIKNHYLKNMEIAEVARIGTTIRVKMPSGFVHNFKGFKDAIHFINNTRTKIVEPIGIPEFFKTLIEKELIVE